MNSKEKNIITVDLTNSEKIVFSQLGINPLIKLGKEYLNSNNFVRIKDNNEEKEKTVEDKKSTPKKSKQISKSKGAQEIEINTKADTNAKDKSAKKTDKSEEIVYLENNDQIELPDELNNARKKRRRSSASIE